VLGVAACELGVEPADDGAAPVCADATVALPMSRIAAAAVRPVFLKVISFSSWGRAWRAVAKAPADLGLTFRKRGGCDPA
jgi:hypothetical protein